MKKALLFTAAMFIAPVAQAATLVTLADFDNAVSEDFEALALGTIAASDPAFAALGITNITASGGRDGFGIRPGTGRSLGLTSSGDLALFDPGTGDVSIDTVTFGFGSAITQFGIAFSDQNFSGRPVTFSLGGTPVDTFSLSTPNSANLNTFFFETTAAFDSITLDLNGVYIDEIHVAGIAPVPLPAGLPLLIAGLGGLGLAARKKKSRNA